MVRQWRSPWWAMDETGRLKRACRIVIGSVYRVGWRRFSSDLPFVVGWLDLSARSSRGGTYFMVPGWPKRTEGTTQTRRATLHKIAFSISVSKYTRRYLNAGNARFIWCSLFHTAPEGKMSRKSAPDGRFSLFLSFYSFFLSLSLSLFLIVSFSFVCYYFPSLSLSVCLCVCCRFRRLFDTSVASLTSYTRVDHIFLEPANRIKMALHFV